MHIPATGCGKFKLLSTLALAVCVWLGPPQLAFAQPPVHPADVWIEAEAAARTNMDIKGGAMYAGRFLRPSAEKPAWAEYDLTIETSGNYLLELAGLGWSHWHPAITWAVDDEALSAQFTGRRGPPYGPSKARWFTLGSAYLAAGKHRLRFQIDAPKPANRLDAIALTRLPDGRAADVLADYLAAGETPPEPVRVKQAHLVPGLRAAIFHEPGMGEDAGAGPLAKKILKELGFHVQQVSAQQLETLTPDQFETWGDLLVMPYGPRFPFEARRALGRYLGRGGRLLWTGLAFGQPMQRTNGGWQPLENNVPARGPVARMSLYPSLGFSAGSHSLPAVGSLSPSAAELLSGLPQELGDLEAGGYFSIGRSKMVGNGVVPCPLLDADVYLTLYEARTTRGPRGSLVQLLRYHNPRFPEATQIFFCTPRPFDLTRWNGGGEKLFKRLTELAFSEFSIEHDRDWYQRRRRLADLMEQAQEAYALAVWTLDDARTLAEYNNTIPVPFSAEEGEALGDKFFELLNRADKLHRQDEQAIDEAVDRVNMQLTAMCKQLRVLIKRGKHVLASERRRTPLLSPEARRTLDVVRKPLHFGGQGTMNFRGGPNWLEDILTKAASMGARDFGTYNIGLRNRMDGRWTDGYVRELLQVWQDLHRRTGVRFVPWMEIDRHYWNTKPDYALGGWQRGPLATDLRLMRDEPAYSGVYLLNEMRSPATGAPAWLQLWREALRQQYGTPAALSKAWGVALADFSQAEPPSGSPSLYPQSATEPVPLRLPDRGRWYDWHHWRTKQMYRATRLTYETARKIVPHLPVITRDYLRRRIPVKNGLDPEGVWRDACDYVGSHIHANTQEFEFLRSVSGGKPLYPSEFYATPYFIPRSLVHNEDVLHRRYRGSLWRGVAHGAIGFHFFLWSGDRGTYMDTSAKEGHFPENIMVTFTNHALLRTFDLRRFSQVSETFGRVLYEGRPVPRSAAILYSATTMINEPWWTGGESESYHVMEAFGWHGSLLDKGIQADYVTENDILAGRLSDYSVLVLPHCAFLPKDITQQMLKYLQAGGTVIASGAAGVWDEHGQPNRLLYKAIGRKEVFEPIATGPPAHPADVWIEGENYSQVSNMTIGGGRTYGGKFLQLASHLGPGGWAEYDFEVKAAGNYLLELAGKAWSHYTCAIKWAVDDGPLLAKIHRRGEPFAPNGTRWFVLGSTYLTAGKHRLRFQVDSSRPADNEWYAWFDAIALSRLPAGRPADVLADYLSGEVKPDGLVALADEMVGRGRLVLLGAKVATRRHLATRWELPGRSPANRIIVAHHRAEWGRWWQQLGLTLPDAPRSGDPDVEVSPWQWNGQTFLIVVNLSLDTPKQVEIQLPQRRQAVDVALAVPVRLRDGLLRTHLLPGAGRVYWLGTKP